MKTKEPQTIELNPLSIPFLMFVILKLTHNINWSWWWVTSPLWISFLLSIVAWIINKFNEYGG